MKYDPSAAIACLPAGTYDASIEKMEETTAKSGAEMIVVTFCIYHDNQTRKLKEWIVFPAFAWKLRRIAKAIDKMTAFESGVFKPGHYEGECLQLDLEVEDSPQYGEQNKIKGYLPKRAGAVATAPDANTGRVDGPTMAALKSVNRPQKPRPQPADDIIQEDDIPF